MTLEQKLQRKIKILLSVLAIKL